MVNKIRPDSPEILNILKSQSHEEIYKYLKDVDLGDKLDDGQTIYHHLLKYTVNGDKILRQILNEYVYESSSSITSENPYNSTLKIDFRSLNINMIKETLKYKTNAHVMDLLHHPVLSAFIDVKWKKIQSFFLINFLIYLTFLFSYSSFLADIFYRQTAKAATIDLSSITIRGESILFPSEEILKVLEERGNKFEFQNGSLIRKKESPEEEEENELKRKKKKKLGLSSTFSKCSSSFSSSTTTAVSDIYKNVICGTEVLLTISIVLLALQETFQLYVLGFLSFFRELENLLEMLILTLSTLCLIFQTTLNVLKWLSAIGISLAYIQLIFLMGRYPFLGGQISLMFYSITRYLYKSVINFIILLLGFSFGFFIICHERPTHSFDNPLKAILKTLVMAFGEFEFNDLYDAHVEDIWSLSFTMVLLVGMILIGSLVMINLLVAIIVSDIEHLRREGENQEITNKCHHVLYLEGIFHFFPAALRRRLERPDEGLSICSHSLCKCGHHKFKNLPALLKILTEKRRRNLLIQKYQEGGKNTTIDLQTTVLKDFLFTRHFDDKEYLLLLLLAFVALLGSKKSHSSK